MFERVIDRGQGWMLFEAHKRLVYATAYEGLSGFWVSVQREQNAPPPRSTVRLALFTELHRAQASIW